MAHMIVDPTSRISRRGLVARSGTIGLGLASAVGSGLPRGRSRAEDPPPDGSDLVHRIEDPEIRAGLEAAITKDLIPAATERAYPGYFEITADGGAYGVDATWPGLDSWRMAGTEIRSCI